MVLNPILEIRFPSSIFCNYSFTAFRFCFKLSGFVQNLVLLIFSKLCYSSNGTGSNYLSLCKRYFHTFSANRAIRIQAMVRGSNSQFAKGTLKQNFKNCLKLLFLNLKYEIL